MPKIIVVPEQEFYNSETNEFYTLKKTTFKIEHSLVSLSKWESKWHLPFLDEHVEKTNEMLIDYIRCMTISQNVDDDIYNHLPIQTIKEINDYIADPMTASKINNRSTKGRNAEYVTSELIYYWMIAQNIPLECEKWHLNRLMTLIQICSEKNAPSKKMSKRDIYKQNRALNEARRAKYGSKG